MRTWTAALGCCVVILITTRDARAQEFLWARQFQLGATGGIGAFSGVAADGAGNVYTVGSFIGTVDFDPGPGIYNLTSAGADDVFVSKLDNAGNLIWARQLGGPSGDQGYCITVDAAGNVYTAGTFLDTADFDPGPGIYSLTAGMSDEAFISKLDNGGNFVWARQIGAGAAPYGVAVDAAGDVHTVGVFTGTADFDPGPGIHELTSAGADDVFVSKLDNSGAFIWVKQLGGVGEDGGEGVALDSAGNVYITGFFNNTVDFDPGPGSYILVSAGGDDIFISKLDIAGNFLWARQLGGPGFDFSHGVALDAAGNVLTVGQFEGTADFDPGPGNYDLTSAGSLDVFISKLDNAGNFVWARRMGGTKFDAGLGVASDAAGNVFAVGQFEGTADFDPGPGIHNLASAGFDDVFISKLDNAGDFVWASQLGGTRDDYADSVAIDAAGNVLTVGDFSGTADFDPGPGIYNLTSVAGNDIFVSKLSGSAVPAGDVANTLSVQYAAAGDITLSWGSSCTTTDDDYGVYEGSIGSWYSHVARLCSTGGLTSATFTPAAGNTYYLIVPRNGQREGSYGAASNGTQRPQGGGACAVQEIAQPCP